MTVSAGASVAAAAGEALAAAEAAFVPERLVEDRGAARRTANVAYRVLKLAAFDLPQEWWLSVANHEVFGHGGRIRELFDGPIAYRIDAPPPYGAGGGSTSFEPDREPDVAERMAISAGGMEANAVAAGSIARRAFIDGEIAPRAAMRYLAFELDTLAYVWSTGDEPEAEGHDVSGIIGTFNAVAARNGAPVLRARTVRLESLVALANPTIVYAAYGIVRHVWSGAASAPVPALSIGGASVLPFARFRLTPFGTEWAVAGHLALPRDRVHAEVSIGRGPGSTPWRVAAAHSRAAPWRGWHVALDGQVWRQPPLQRTPLPLATAMSPGGMLRARIERAVVPVWFSRDRATLLMELGVKSAGYVPGEPLRRGAVIRAGVGLPLPRR